MKPVIQSCKLPRWATFLLPYECEEYILKSVIIPILMLLLVGIAVSLSEFYEDFCPPTFVVIILVGLLFVIVWWLLCQTDILYALRKRLITHYRTTTDEEEKLRTKKRLKTLWMKV
jgi:hypothetical protein